MKIIIYILIVLSVLTSCRTSKKNTATKKKQVTKSTSKEKIFEINKQEKNKNKKNVQIDFFEVKKETEEEDEVYFIVEKMPVFPGGDLGLREYVAKNTKYPDDKCKLEGRVYVQFCVTSQGEIEKVKIIRSVHHLLDKEAIRVIENMPKWIPGEQRGKKVNVWYTIPFKFELK